MKQEIKYIELKSNFNHDGPAWIGLVSFSKSGRTIYFNGKAFQRIGSDRISGNYFDIESGEAYWISGIKKDQRDRHKYGKGFIFVEERILETYLSMIKHEILDARNYKLCQVEEHIPKERINIFENEIVEEKSRMDDNKRLLKPSEMTLAELDYFIEYFDSASVSDIHLKSRKMSRNKRNELQEEKNKRIRNISA